MKILGVVDGIGSMMVGARGIQKDPKLARTILKPNPVIQDQIEKLSCADLL